MTDIVEWALRKKATRNIVAGPWQHRFQAEQAKQMKRGHKGKYEVVTRTCFPGETSTNWRPIRVREAA